MGQQVTFNSGSASLEEIIVNSKIDLHRHSHRQFEDKQGRGVKWVYGKRGVNGMEGRVKKLNLNPIFTDVGLGVLSCGFLFWAWACLCSGRQALGWERSEMLMESVGEITRVIMEIVPSHDSLSPSSSLGSSVAKPMTMRPESPSHGGFDLYGKRRLVLKVHALEREIGLLEEELKSLDGMQPASICCQELDTFIVAKPDPFIAKNQDIQKSHNFWKRIWAKCCLKLPWVCCFSGCQIRLKLPNLCVSCRPFSKGVHVNVAR
ncbi:hypothetical protein CMV_017001 [Castanea mollissima]|uniref:G protein gamma domain-containing protein n=1 Tax=Castanea mollissima TaxID=60419 RepID=A0A8J4VIX1_9ROSI|nr:hypothetical protein CMV_017001 [Castanea mollissima]